MYIDLRNAIQEGISLYRITLIQPLNIMDFLIGLMLLSIYPIVILLCLASNCHSDQEVGLHFHRPRTKGPTHG